MVKCLKILNKIIYINVMFLLNSFYFCIQKIVKYLHHARCGFFFFFEESKMKYINTGNGSS